MEEDEAEHPLIPQGNDVIEGFNFHSMSVMAWRTNTHCMYM